MSDLDRQLHEIGECLSGTDRVDEREVQRPDGVAGDQADERRPDDRFAIPGRAVALDEDVAFTLQRHDARGIGDDPVALG